MRSSPIANVRKTSRGTFGSDRSAGMRLRPRSSLDSRPGVSRMTIGQQGVIGQQGRQLQQQQQQPRQKSERRRGVGEYDDVQLHHQQQQQKHQLHPQSTGSGRWGVCERLRQFLPHLSMGRRERSGRRGVALRISGTIQWDNPRCKDTQRDSGAQREREREREREG